MIRAGGTFYIIGSLDVTKKPDGSTYTNPEEGIDWPTDFALPPYNNDGATKQVRRIFMQDFMTTANFKLGVNSLKSAYVTVPDLRASKISLGLSVDLNWESGMTFNNVILGQ